MFLDSLKKYCGRFIPANKADYFIRIPEFDLTESEREFLWRHYMENVDQDVYYIARDGKHDGNVWNGSINLRKVPIFKDRVSRLQIEWKAYFHLQKPNTIVEPHKDENRLAVINIPISNKLDTPTRWFRSFPKDENEKPIFLTQYANRAYLINVRQVHGVRNDNPHLRLMLQFNFHRSYFEIRDLYYSKKLFR